MPAAGLATRSMIGLAVFLLIAVVKILEERIVMMPVLQSLRGKLDSSEESLLLLEITTNKAVAEANATLLQLKEARESLSQLKRAHETDEVTIASLQQELEESRQKFDTLRNATSHKNETAAEFHNDTGVVYDPTDVCSVFPPSKSSSATRLWKEHLPAILEASRNELMPEKFQTDGERGKIRKVLEAVLSPARMRRAVRHLPTFSHHILDRVMGILQKRLADPEKHPPLRVAVFGGSVTMGRGCTGREKNGQRVCAWPKRFELLVNQFFGQEVIRVYNLAVGGTTSRTGTDRVKYWLYGDEELKKHGPDVVINSYSTNDSLPRWDAKWPEDDLVQEVQDQVRNALQTFVREALQSRACSIPPLVVHVDDYVGPQQPALLGELSYVTAMTQIAKYYDTVGISYAEVVRDLVYSDQDDKTFANKKDVHYGYLAHQTIAWSVGFASLQLMINYCDDKFNLEEPADKSKKLTNLTNDDKKWGRLYLPPPLTRDLLVKDTTAKFKSALDITHHTHLGTDCDLSESSNSSNAGPVDRNPCIHSWISTPGNCGADCIREFMGKYGTMNDGWQAEKQNDEGWGNKEGWVATKANATMMLRFPNVEKNVKTVTIYFLRSYGEKWKDSKARFTVSRLPQGANTTSGVVVEEDIAGVHASEDYRYSLTMSETYLLSEIIPKGDTLELQVDLLAGIHFKIMGLMFCNK